MKKILLLTVLLFVAALSFSCIGKEMREHFKSLQSKDEIVVVIFGDEISAGGISEETKSWGNYLKPKLAELFHTRISLINTSRSGENFGTAHRRVEADILSYRPDIVFVMLGMSDVLSSGGQMSSFKNNVDNFFSKLKENGAYVIILTSPGLNDAFSRDDPRLAMLREYNKVIFDSSQIYSYPFIDIATEMEGIMLTNINEYRALFSDFYLLSDKGNQVVADFIYKKIKSKVKTGNDN